MRRNIVITAVIFIGMALLGVFVFSDSYLRLGECFRDLGNSAAYYFCKLFGIESDIMVTVNGYSDVFSWGTVLPEDFDEFKKSTGDYFALLLDAENFAGWGNAVADFLEVALKVLLLALPCVFILIMLVKKLYKSGNTKHGKDTVPLKVFKWLARRTYQPVKRAVLAYREFLQEYRVVCVLWLIGWVLHLNLAGIVIEFIAYYLWFVVSFDILTLYTQVNKLLIDLQVIFKHFPWWSIVMAAYLLFTRWRKRIALGRLRHFEARNCGFINELPIVSMSCGSMGKKKVRPEMA